MYLFDEFDDLGTDRASRNEVGEIRRVLNSFLQFIEHDDSDSIIVAATNHPALLDRALMRRFDAVVRYDLPDKTVALHVLKNRLGLPQETVENSRRSEFGLTERGRRFG